VDGALAYELRVEKPQAALSEKASPLFPSERFIGEVACGEEAPQQLVLRVEKLRWLTPSPAACTDPRDRLELVHETSGQILLLQEAHNFQLLFGPELTETRENGLRKELRGKNGQSWQGEQKTEWRSRTVLVSVNVHETWR
jgi:hypothetical protein